MTLCGLLTITSTWRLSGWPVAVEETRCPENDAAPVTFVGW